MSKSGDIGKQQVGAVYAKALIGVVEKSGKTDEVIDELESLVDQLIAAKTG